MKWIIFICAAVGAYPVGHWLRGRDDLQIRLWTVIAFLPFYSTLDMGLIPFGARPGDTYGVEVALIDWLVLVLAFAQVGPGRPLPHRRALAAYYLVVLVSVTQASWTLGAFGYVWKLSRMYLVYAVACSAGRDRRLPAALIKGMMLGIVYESFWAVWQHFGQGHERAVGTFAHQNTLGMLVNLVVMVPIALVLVGRTTRITALAPVAAAVICLLTVSRGALLFLGAGSVFVYLVSSWRHFDMRKAKIGLLGVALALAIVPVALSRLSIRPAEEQDDSMQLRVHYVDAAAMMLADHPLGVGVNHFALMLLTGGYGDRADVNWTQRIAQVHNVYWLTAAEMGYAGVVTLVVLFLAPLLPALRACLRARRDRRGDILLGLCTGLLLLYVHSFFEWAWRITAVSYVYWMSLAALVCLTRQLRDEQPAPVRRPAGRRLAPALTYAKS